MGGYTFDEYRVEDPYTKFVKTAQDSGYFSGDLILKCIGNSIYLQNIVDEEDYVISCTQNVVQQDTIKEYIKAVAVIIRTYLYHLISENIYMFPDSLPYWKYTGVGNISKLVKTAVEETKGEVLTYLGMPIYPLITYCTGGFTVPYEEIFGDTLAYAISVEDSLSRICPFFTWKLKIPVEEIKYFTRIEKLDSVKIVNFTVHLIPDTIVFYSKNKLVIIRGPALYQTLYPRLPSPSFYLEMRGDTLVFEGKGKGILIGLPLWSAKQMALNEETYRKILNYYFPVSELTKITSR